MFCPLLAELFTNLKSSEENQSAVLPRYILSFCSQTRAIILL